MSNLSMAKERRDGKLTPRGKYDDYGLWYPSPWEHCECCDRIKHPTKNRPLTLLKHCRTLKHVKNLIEKHKRH